MAKQKLTRRSKKTQADIRNAKIGLIIVAFLAVLLFIVALLIQQRIGPHPYHH